MKAGEVIRNCREKRGLTQAELSRKSGLHQSTICLIEKGERGTTVYNLVMLLKAMDYDLAVIDNRK